MAGLKKVAAVALAVAFAVVAAFLLRPAATPPTGSVVINEPDQPDTPTTPDTPNPDTPDDGSDEPASPPPPVHGKFAQNSNGPKHAVCLPANSQIPDHAQDEGANRYRGTCTSFPGKGPR